MKKIELINAITNNGGKSTENENVFKMSYENFDNLLFDIDGEKFTVNENERIFKIGKSSITIKLMGKSKTPTGGNGHKSRNTGYIIIMKNMDDKKPTTINNINNCTEIKSWIKTLNRKNIEYLRIYDTMNNECRKSAWIER